MFCRANRSDSQKEQTKKKTLMLILTSAVQIMPGQMGWGVGGLPVGLVATAVRDCTESHWVARANPSFPGATGGLHP